MNLSKHMDTTLDRCAIFKILSKNSSTKSIESEKKVHKQMQLYTEIQANTV